MRDALVMWRNTRLVVLAAMSGSLYAALLIPFKVLPLIPGVTELRPANAMPVVCSLLFGPAAAWGAAIGNLIGDFFGGIGPGDLFGFAGNGPPGNCRCWCRWSRYCGTRGRGATRGASASSSAWSA